MDRSPVQLVVPLAFALLLSGCVAQLETLVYEPEPPLASQLEAADAAPVGTERDMDLDYRHEALTVVAHDGILLNVDAWIPNVTGPVPVVLIQSPYFENGKVGPERTPAPGFYEDVVGEFVFRGYAVALADLRGTAWSDGCMDLVGPNEQQDAVTVVEFLGTQPWSNGKVGMIGASYDGATQIMAAARGAEHLAAIVPIAPITDLYHGLGKGGAKFAGWTPGTVINYNLIIGMGIAPPSAPSEPGPPEPPAAPDPEDPRFDRADDQACAAQNLALANEPVALYSPYFQARDLRPLAPQATAAMLYTHGLVDVNARPDHIDPWYNAYGGPKRAFLWQQPHDIPSPANTGRGDDWWLSVVAWFDHHLYGYHNGVNATYGTVEVQDSLGRWRNESAWPPLDAAPLAFPLAPESLLPPGSAAPAGSATWRDDVRERGGTPGNKSAVPLQGSTDTRLVFRGLPLDADVHYAGRPVVHLEVTTDRPTTHVVARLYEILPDGSWVLVNEGVQSLLLREALDAPAPVAPGERVVVDVAMQPGDFVFRAGRAIGLTLTSSDGDYVVPPGTLATTTALFGPSALVLPTIGRDDFTTVTWGFEQPTWMGPHAWEGSA